MRAGESGAEMSLKRRGRSFTTSSFDGCRHDNKKGNVDKKKVRPSEGERVKTFTYQREIKAEKKKAQGGATVASNE